MGAFSLVTRHNTIQKSTMSKYGVAREDASVAARSCVVDDGCCGGAVILMVRNFP